MSHPIPGHDYSEQHNRETNKEYRKRSGQRVESSMEGYKKHLKKSKGILKKKGLGALNKALESKK